MSWTLYTKVSTYPMTDEDAQAAIRSVRNRKHGYTVLLDVENVALIYQTRVQPPAFRALVRKPAASQR